MVDYHFFTRLGQSTYMTFEELHADVREFCEKREWEQYHTPKELAIGMVTESSELLEQFRFKNQTEQSELLAAPSDREAIEDEVADVLFFVLRFADLYDVDLDAALTRKLEKNKARYPANEYKGRNEKYDE